MTSSADYAQLRRQVLEQHAGTSIKPITNRETFIGVWDMRFGGLAGSDKVQWRYDFRPDGRMLVGDETWRWNLNDDGSFSLVVPVKADPSISGLEEDTASEELRLPFLAEDGRIILSNDDTSVVEILSPVSTEGT